SSYLGDQLASRVMQDSGGHVASSVSYTYEGNGNIASETDGDGNVTSYTYDANGNVLTERTYDNQHPANLIRSYTYRNAQDGNVTHVSDSLGSTLSLEYDGLGQLWRLRYIDANGHTAREDIGHDLAGQPTGEARYADLAGTLLAGSTTIGHEGPGQVSSIEH